MMNSMNLPSTAVEEKLPSFVDTRPVSPKWLACCAVMIVMLYCSLWSSYWYPLSDSALYLSLGKSLANGDGYQFLGETNRLAAPLTPIMIAVVFRMGGGIGTLHLIMTALMLLGLALAYLTLQTWVSARAALGATLATAVSYWVAQCVTIVMTEPLCVALFWGTFYALTMAVRCESRKSRTLWLTSALMMLLASFENRAAMILLLPGILIAFWNMGAKVATRGERLAWMGCFCFVLGTAFWDYRYSGQLTTYISQVSIRLKAEPISDSILPSTQRLDAKTSTSNPLLSSKRADQVRDKTRTVLNSQNLEAKENALAAVAKTYARQNSRYRFILPPVATMLKYPYYFGRWICEVMLAPTVSFFETENRLLLAVGCFFSLGALMLTLIGLRLMLVQRQWWILGLITYCLPIWMIWSARIIPRYMIPFAPVFFLLIWYALSWLLLRLRENHLKHPNSAWPVGHFVLAGMLGVLLVGNLPPLAVELYLRHSPQTNFYQVARRGATKELLDISAYIREHSSPDEIVGCNAEFFHRVVHYLTAKPVKSISFRRTDPQLAMQDSKCRFVIVFSTNDAPWPNWHLPLATKESQPCWWQLYVRKRNGRYKRVDLSTLEVARTNPQTIR